MVNLNWKGKEERIEILPKKNETTPFHILDYYPSTRIDRNSEDYWENMLIWGENKTVMNLLLKKYENKITLIYIDPPFATGGDFNLKIQIGENGKFLDSLAYRDKWRDGLDSYLKFLYERLVLMKGLLTSEGSIYVHLDWHISHYIKLIMDEIFGIENFRNEIIWAYPAASARTKRFFMRSFNTILFYTKSDDYIFNDDPNIYMEYSDRVKTALKKDEKGTYYYRGGSHDGKKLSRKVYVEQEGIFPRDVWNDIPYIRANTSEYQGFSTQKPERLLKRIILASTNEKDIVADFFCGSGTTLAVAEKLGRNWIGCDSNRNVIHITRKRILNIRHSNDMLNWKTTYNRNPQSFKILGLNKNDESYSIPNVLLCKDVQSEQAKIKETPDLNVKIYQKDNKIMVELLNYKIPFTHLISDKVKENIKSFSDWIDYWAIDFESQNNIFRNMWFSYRTPKVRTLPLISESYQYDKLGNYNVLVKVIDIFGIESIKSYKIKTI